jgi:hypothetical protein
MIQTHAKTGTGDPSRAIWPNLRHAIAFRSIRPSWAILARTWATWAPIFPWQCGALQESRGADKQPQPLKSCRTGGLKLCLPRAAQLLTVPYRTRRSGADREDATHLPRELIEPTLAWVKSWKDLVPSGVKTSGPFLLARINTVSAWVDRCTKCVLAFFVLALGIVQIRCARSSPP